MSEIRIKCPAKINLTLEIVNKREDGFHNIKSIMQTIDLYDFLNIKAEIAGDSKIVLSGNNSEIPYDKSNLVYKAAELFLKKTGFNACMNVHIEKNIPVAAGLAGGSSDAAGTFYGLNKLFGEPLNKEMLHVLCAELGSDLNVCLEGGCILAASRGEKIKKIKTIEAPVTIIKPKHLGISAKEAYTKYAAKKIKPKYNMTERMLDAIENEQDIKEFLYNDLEYAVFDDYEELQKIKSSYPEAVMSGSGSAYYILNHRKISLDSNYQVISGLNFINGGISEA